MKLAPVGKSHPYRGFCACWPCRIEAGSLELHPRETVRALTAGVLGITEGQPQDDATVLCLDWHGTSGLGRQSSAGASQHSASP